MFACILCGWFDPERPSQRRHTLTLGELNGVQTLDTDERRGRRLASVRPIGHPTVSKLWILKPGVENAQMGEGVG
jgi:hypothetical protein